MKTTFTFTFLAFTLCLFSQNLYLTGNTTLPLQGGNCGNGNQTSLTYQDVNLNGYTLTLRNVSLTVSGNINGAGSIVSCGNQNNSSVCYSGSLQNGANLNGLTCQSLSTPKFNIQKDHGLPYKVYDLSGRLLKVGITDLEMYYDIPYDTILLLEVKGFETEKKYLSSYENK